jgi:hypothetical protein
MTLPDGATLLQALVTGLLLGGLFALAALGLSLVVGVVRVVNLMHGELVLLGAYAAWLLVQYTGLNPLLLAPVAALIVALIGAPIERYLLHPVAKHGSEAPLLTTFALSIILQNLLVYVLRGDTRSLDSGLNAQRWTLGPISIPVLYLLAFLVSLLVSPTAHLVDACAPAPRIPSTPRSSVCRCDACMPPSSHWPQVSPALAARCWAWCSRSRRPPASNCCSPASPSWCSADWAA